MTNIGEWVEFPVNGKKHQGFVLKNNLLGSTIETLGVDYKVGQPYKKMTYHVPHSHIKPLQDEFLPHDRDMCIDMALASGNKGLFQSLVGSESVIN